MLKLFLFAYLRVGLCLLAMSGCAFAADSLTMDNKSETAILGGGCFWCTEAVYQRVNGVLTVESGYSGGQLENPTYEQISSGATGHAEVIKVTFAPSVISYAEILEIFFHTHDPTTLNRQGADSGTQYRSVIFYADEIQKNKAEEVKAKIEAEKLWSNPIVTEISPLKVFYKAEDYHQNYYNSNTNKPYCSLVIGPKLQKLYKDFADKLKK